MLGNVGTALKETPVLVECGQEVCLQFRCLQEVHPERLHHPDKQSHEQLDADVVAAFFLGPDELRWVIAAKDIQWPMNAAFAFTVQTEGGVHRGAAPGSGLQQALAAPSLGEAVLRDTCSHARP